MQSQYLEVHQICRGKYFIVQGDTKKRELLKKTNKNWRNPRKKIIDRNWTIKTCLL